uniref:Ubiquitin-like domain-containing protein n=1 Tax=Anopheles culicifacies TaxID=139723 RepID=A0A182M860_9DIPT
MNEFLQSFPFLVQLEPYHFVGLYQKVYKIKLYFPKYPTTDSHRVTVFHGNHPIALPSEQSSIVQVDKYVHNLLATLDSANVLPNAKTPATYEDSIALTNLALELLSIQQQHGCKVAFDKTLMHIELTNFHSGGNHCLNLQRIGGELFKVAHHTLPELAVGEIVKRQTTLQRHVQVFLDTLEQLEEFYSNLSTIDELCFVILPATIDTKTTYRIFKYDQKVFLKISLHPLQPAAVDIAFFGPTKQVAKLREIYDEKQDDWDPECNVYTNLVRIFNIIAFPMRSAAGEQSDHANKVHLTFRWKIQKMDIFENLDNFLEKEMQSLGSLFQSIFNSKNPTVKELLKDKGVGQIKRSFTTLNNGYNRKPPVTANEVTKLRTKIDSISLDSDDEGFTCDQAQLDNSLTANNSFETENYIMRIKVKWFGGIETFEHRRFQKFADIFAKLAEKNSVDSACIMLNLNDSIVHPSDTPDSINYKPNQFISGRIFRGEAPALPVTVAPSATNNNTITLKIQMETRKQPLRLQIDKQQTMSVLVIKCAEELNCQPKDIKLYFDGEQIDTSSKPEDLDLEGDEILDIRMAKRA